jgi:hypothetical protein
MQIDQHKLHALVFPKINTGAGFACQTSAPPQSRRIIQLRRKMAAMRSHSASLMAP